MNKSDLPNSEALDQELMFWKRKWSVIKSEHRSNTLAKAIKICDENQYSNLFELLKIGCTLPITSTECKHSFSAMQRLRTWLRARMTDDRLGSLAIMNIHYNEIVDYKQVSKLFFTLHPRKLYKKSLVFE
ncbi:52 kDa repressor of the inhibitor of the protein kinase-like [Hydra vulgaris]|uniref:52 kDa repressor of the inhibitor of the protein kinase-like n=1 Tax=Hydra vulgaris TaxID=6087 RepID=A0ABM4D166_HYDVU